MAARARIVAGYVLVAAGLAFMLLGSLLAYRGGVTAGLLSAASGATALVVGGDLLKSSCD